MSSQETYADVLLPQRAEHAYTYSIPQNLFVQVGSFVEVPLRSKLVPGVVWKIHSHPTCNVRKIKAISRVFDLSILPEVTRDFIQWVANYTMSPLGNVLKMGMSVPQALETEKEGGVFVAAGCDINILNEKRKSVIEYLAQAREPLSILELSLKSLVSISTIRSMLERGQLMTAPLQGETLAWSYKHLILGEEQKAAAQEINQQVTTHAFHTFLLDGITGSGKTEVYFDAIATALEEGKQTLILLPEISLSTQWIQRFTDRFGAPPVVWHSDITPPKRRKAWRQILEGEAKVVVGARSALFLPYPHLGLIVVDEEHESAYKQEEGVIYNARDMAVVRGRMEKCPVVLVSATPSLETLENAQTGKYAWLKLTSRHGQASLPDIHIIDLRNRKKRQGEEPRWISAPLQEAIQVVIDNQQQSLVFLNRRGYAPLTLCQACGERVSCPNCSAWLVEHKKYDRLLCHHCGHLQQKPKECPKCGDKENMLACGPGVERVAEELEKLFPTARLEIMASDVMTSVNKLQAVINDLHKGKIDIVVGTQMVAKGHHFPNLTVVGVVDADLGLAGGDLRSGERTYQLLNQVSGRAGREELPGRVYLQTFNPDHPVLKALLSGQREDFLSIETAGRQMNQLPPYGRLAALIISARDKAIVETYTRALARVIPRKDGLDILGPAPAALSMVRGWYRYRFLIKATKEIRLQPIIRAWIESLHCPSQIKLQIDIDPYSFL